jgi:dihydrofolate reductase
MGKPLVVIIAALSENRVIGKDGAIPWSVREDMRRFRELTTGFPCIMGRKTWESLPKKPLPGRLNIVISKTLTPDASGDASGETLVFPSLDEALKHCRGHEKVFICGGASLYREALPLAERMEITMIHKTFEGDVFFPEIDSEIWTENTVLEKDGFSFVSFVRRKQKQQ